MKNANTNNVSRCDLNVAISIGGVFRQSQIQILIQTEIQNMKNTNTKNVSRCDLKVTIFIGGGVDGGKPLETSLNHPKANKY